MGIRMGGGGCLLSLSSDPERLKQVGVLAQFCKKPEVGKVGQCI